MLLPEADEAYRSLCANGDQFATAPLKPETIEGVAYHHPRRGTLPVLADSRVIDATGMFYVQDGALREALQGFGAQAMDLKVGVEVMAQYYEENRLILGVSGFASTGYPCKAQAEMLSALYRHLAATSRPAIVCDGATGAGVLGLNGLLAARYGIPSFGVSALEGLSSMAPRNHLMVYGDTYRDREVVVGLLSDVLVCVDGGDGAKRECLWAVRNGGSVLLLMSEASDISTLGASWQQEPELVDAFREKRLVFCRSMAEILTHAGRVWHAGATESRGMRLKQLGTLVLQ